MADMWDIAAHVESHPDDYQQRWRLAKKLYAAHEYRLVLEHLNVLKNEWTPKVNVRRYLAATYYRLGRYSEAIAELEETIAEWPEEIGIREQMAYVLKADKRLPEALEAWEEVLRLQPDHVIALKSVRKLQAKLAAGKDTDPPAHLKQYPPDEAGADGGDIPTPPPMPGMECTQCGAQNSEEFGDCWRCGHPLPHAAAAGMPPALFEQADRSLPLQAKTVFRIAVVATLALLLYALFLGTRLLLNFNETASPLVSTTDIYAVALAPARIAAGLAMLLTWPIALRITLRMCGVKKKPKPLAVHVAATFLGTLALVLLLMPMPAPLLLPGAAILLFIALTIIVVVFQLQIARALLVWALHFVAVIFIGAIVFYGTEVYRFGEVLNPVAEITTLRHFAKTTHESGVSTPVRLSSAITPIREQLVWQSSGSRWLDAKAATIIITIRLEETAPDLRFQIYEEGDLRFHEEIGEHKTETFQYEITPDKAYAFSVPGPENLIVQVFIQSLLPFEFIE